MSKSPKALALQILAQFPEGVSLKVAATVAEHVAINEDSGCWEWTGPLNQEGYGVCLHRGRRTSPHRLVAFLFNPEADRRLTVDHVCRNRKCVNPNHLEIVTLRENTLRMWQFRVKTGNAGTNRTHCSRGHELTEDNVRWSKGRKRCRTCDQERCKKRYREHPELLRQAYEKWKASDPEAYRRYQKEYREKNKERYRAHRKKYEQTRDKEAQRQRVAEWRKQHPEKVAEYKRRAAEKRKGRIVQKQADSEESS